MPDEIKVAFRRGRTGLGLLLKRVQHCGRTLMGSGIGSIPMDGAVKSIGELLQAIVPGGFEILTKTFPLSEVEHVWAEGSSMPRIVFQLA